MTKIKTKLKHRIVTIRDCRDCAALLVVCMKVSLIAGTRILTGIVTVAPMNVYIIVILGHQR